MSLYLIVCLSSQILSNQSVAYLELVARWWLGDRFRLVKRNSVTINHDLWIAVSDVLSMNFNIITTFMTEKYQKDSNKKNVSLLFAI